MKNKKLNDIPESGNIIDETAFCEKVHESIEEEGRYYNELNEKLKNDPQYQLTPEKLAGMEKRLKHPYRLGRGRVRSYRRLNKVTICVSVLLIILLVGVVSVSSLRDYTINFLLGLNESHGDIYQMPNGILVGQENTQVPTLLPEGYKLSGMKSLDDSSVIEYTSPDGEMLVLTQRQFDNPGTLDTENSEVKEVTINGYEGRLSMGEDGTAQLIWLTEDNLFTLLATDNSIDLVPIAESVSKTK